MISHFIKLKTLCTYVRPTKLLNVITNKRIFNARSFCVGETAINVNTNVAKDVILFKYDNPRFFKLLNIFSICQFGFWAYLSHFAYYHLKDAPVPKGDAELPWWRRFNLGENKYRNTITTVAFLIGYGILVVSWMYTLKSVRYLILRKGGKDVSFVTYTPFGHNRILTVNLQNVSCKETRSAAPAQLPIKVKNHYLHYILDMKGEFKNTALFDHTAGLRRTFRSANT